MFETIGIIVGVTVFACYGLPVLWVLGCAVWVRLTYNSGNGPC